MNKKGSIGIAHQTLRAKKEFGQHFLVAKGAILSIVAETLRCPAPALLEIGPGGGAITGSLLVDGRPLFAMELDAEAGAVLRERFETLEHFHLVMGDATALPMPGPGPWAVVGNLPYNAATAILTRFLVEDVPWQRMVLMFQLEVGQKLMGKPSEKQYGPLSVLAQLTTDMAKLMKLGPSAFAPPPKVDSIVLTFEPRKDAPQLDLRKAFLSWLHRSFGHRRKTLSNNWAGVISPEQVRGILEGEGLNPAIRAEALTPEQCWRLFLAFQQLERIIH
ncbi:MAG: ribosomal RNA small subunit methyltransferase A [Holophagaceae bacterium]|nr:ribosomal RNA small subunit methyltransferase A [Holophagaceae bacterium]